MTENDSSSSAAPSGSPLPFDPWRLLGGVRLRQRWIVFGLIGGLFFGLAVGFFRSATRYEASVRLMRREVPNSFRVGEIGEAFKPRAVNAATLVGVALSDNVLARVAARTVPTLSPELLRRSAEAREQRGTDFVVLTLSGYVSAEATAKTANLWAEEIVHFSREMQTKESREARTYLQQQLELTDAEINRNNGEILQVSKREGLVNADKQVDAYLRSLGDLDLRLHAASIELDTAGKRLRTVEAEIRRLSPERDRLAAAERELEEALRRYAEQNPIILDLRDLVARLKTSVAETTDQAVDPAALAGSALGSALYLQSIDLRAQIEGLQQQIQKLQEFRSQTRAALEAVPEKSAQLARLLQTHHSLDNARAMLFARLREAQHFEEKAPGYFQLFSAAEASSVGSRPRWLKLLVYACLGLVAGSGLASFCAVSAELIDSRLRTAAEASRLYRAPLLANLLENSEPADWQRTVETLWLQWISTHAESRRPSAVWCPAPSNYEDCFWSALVDEAARLLDSLTIIDAGETPSARLAALTGTPIGGIKVQRLDPRLVSLAEVRALRDRLATQTDRPICVRFSGPVREPVTTLARICASPLVLVAADTAPLYFWENHSRLLTTAGCVPAGLVVAGESVFFHR